LQPLNNSVWFHYRIIRDNPGEGGGGGGGGGGRLPCGPRINDGLAYRTTVVSRGRSRRGPGPRLGTPVHVHPSNDRGISGPPPSSATSYLPPRPQDRQSRAADLFLFTESIIIISRWSHVVTRPRLARRGKRQIRILSVITSSAADPCTRV